jgi:hypothetical protein
MLRKIVSIFLVFVFAIFLMGCIIPVANADSFPSPTVTEHDMRARYFPDVASNLYRICDSDGNLIRFIEFKDVNYSLLDDLKKITSDVKFAFNIDINTEFANDEYMELILLNENEITVYNNGIKVPVEKFGEYNIVHIIDSGLIIVS